ncbi:MAG: 2-oxoacid:ferredoxin oxidoreductase subunit beta [Dehalococcoidales bacterium]|nr:2-oxoacid:ferredoxin oxidoreductase subunit beta [Dehalococcoidales bacterium]
MTQQGLPMIHKYLRSHKKFPHIWCPGCGAGNVLGAIIRAVDRLELEKDEIAMVSGIGCSGRMPVYVDFNTLHTTHGRALAFATGIKLAKPSLKVMVIMGDGDALAIGGNHFIHAARRNIDLTAIIVNNNIYGLTGGQYSPTTPLEARATTATYGHIEQPFDIAKLAEGAGAAFVARGTVYHVAELDKLIEAALRKKGFSVVEVLSHCHTAYGRLNQMKSPVDMLKWQRENTIPAAAVAKGKDPEGKILRGVLVDRDLPEFTEVYYSQVVGRAQQSVGRAEG